MRICLLIAMLLCIYYLKYCESTVDSSQNEEELRGEEPRRLNYWGRYT